MINKIFLLKTLNVKNSTNKVLDKEVENVMLSRLGSLLDIDDAKNIAIGDDNGSEFIFMKLPEYKVFNVKDLLMEYFDVTLTEVTEDIILGVLDEYKKIHNGVYYKEFFVNFRLSNAITDDILDKINSYGIESLDEIDKMILNK